jgi:hypothetical protein
MHILEVLLSQLQVFEMNANSHSHTLLTFICLHSLIRGMHLLVMLLREYGIEEWRQVARTDL